MKQGGSGRSHPPRYNTDNNTVFEISSEAIDLQWHAKVAGKRLQEVELKPYRLSPVKGSNSVCYGR